MQWKKKNRISHKHYWKQGGDTILHCLFHIILRQICLVFICPNRAIRGVFITRQEVMCNTVMDKDTI